MKIIVDICAGFGERRRGMIESRGHKYITIDHDPRFKCTITEDIFNLKDKDIGFVDFVWVSFPCEAFSVASIGHHWMGGKNAYIPKTKHARYSKRLVVRGLRLIRDLKKINPNLSWLAENPRGVLRKMPFMQNLPRTTVTYCQYGDVRMKPTDLWGEMKNWTPKKMCKNGDPCHVSAPRGSRTGTQGMKNAAERAVVPIGLWESLLDALEAS